MDQILVDSNFVYAMLSPSDSNYRTASIYYKTMIETAILPSVTLPEIAFLANRVGGTPAVIEVMVAVKAEFRIIELVDQDYDRVLEILKKYTDTRIDFVDACIMALAERLKITRILTFDRRDFGIYRPAHVKQFELLP